jgi:hypothetical protein
MMESYQQLKNLCSVVTFVPECQLCQFESFSSLSICD